MDFSRKLAKRADAGLLRQHQVVSGPQGIVLSVDDQELIGFCSNDYLGLANHSEVVKAFKSAADEYGVGSGASHLISGHTRAHQKLEQELAAFTGYPRALLFSTGYMANLAVLTALTDRHEFIYQDKMNHASLIDAGQLSRAKVRRYKHRNIDDLKRLVKTDQPDSGLIVTDGVFSMEGTIAPLDQLSEVALANNLLLIVDDAHGLGQVAQGYGSKASFGLTDKDLPVLVGTLGKAFGTFGAFVAASDEIIEMLIQFARSYTYTTAPPAALAEATRASLKLIQRDKTRYQRLQQNIEYFRKKIKAAGLNLGDSTTAIQFIAIPEIDRLLDIQQQLKQSGYLVGTIRPPTVPQAGIRITLSSEHTEIHIAGLVRALAATQEKAA